MMKFVRDIEKRPFLSLLPILLLAFSLRLHALDSQSLWWDELKTLQRATLPLPNLLTDFINTRDQLPAYYLLMRGWVRIGDGGFALRLFSVMWGMLGVTAVYKLGHQIGSTKTGLTAAFLLAISPFHIYYSQETRMYSMLVTLLILAHVGLIGILQSSGKRYWLLYFLAMTTAVYTHYFTFLIIFAHTIFFILHLRPLKSITLRWFGLMTLLAVLFIPWGSMIVSRSGYDQAIPVWINTVKLTEPILTLWTFSIGATLSRTSLAGILGFTLFMLGLLGSYRAFRKQSKDKNSVHKLLFLWLFVPLLFIYLISLGNGSFSLYLDRYLIVVLPVYLLLVAWGWVHLTGHSVPWLLGLGVLATAVTTPSLLNLYNNPIFARNDWQAVINHIDTNSSEKYLLLGHKDLLLPINYYGNERISFLQIPPPESNQMTPAFDEIMERRLAIAAQTNNLVWHIEPFYIYHPHGLPEQRNDRVSSEIDNLTQIWLKSHFTLLEEAHFPGIRITLYNISDSAP
ncbi:MAG: hypothetical protein GY805_15475 [Chloroflexi bacterium]|nr:hypothetical protein [Chloroflexota bacterium]